MGFLILWCCVSRHPVHRAADQPRWGHWGHPDGPTIGVWCGQLPLHLHVLLPQVDQSGPFILLSSCLPFTIVFSGLTFQQIKVHSDTWSR